MLRGPRGHGGRADGMDGMDGVDGGAVGDTGGGACGSVEIMTASCKNRGQSVLEVDELGW